MGLTRRYCLYKLVNLDKDRDVIYDINVKELDQVFGLAYNALSFEYDYLEFIEWMQKNAQLIMLKTGEKVYVLPPSHKIKYLSFEMKAVIAYIQNDGSWVICSDQTIHSAKYEGFWFNLWMKFRKATGFYSKTIHDLFRVKVLDELCRMIESRGNGVGE